MTNFRNTHKRKMDGNVMKRKMMKVFNSGYDLLFKKVHKSKLIYNA